MQQLDDLWCRTVGLAVVCCVAQVLAKAQSTVDLSLIRPVVAPVVWVGSGPKPATSFLRSSPGTARVLAEAEHTVGLYALCRATAVPLDLVGSGPKPATPRCFDPATAITERQEIWIRLHIHAYRDDSCRGNFFPWIETPVAPENLYAELRKLVTQANDVAANLSIPWGDEAVFDIPVATEPAYLPIRFYLDGVSLHCDGAAQTLGSSPSRLREWYDVPDALNLHLVEWVGSSNGQAESIGGASTHFSIELLSPTLLIHEAMHLFNLAHPFENDGIDDTPVKRFAFDYNQDGDTKDNFRTTNPKCPAIGSEAQMRGCYLLKQDLDGGPHYIDYDGDCINDYTFESVGHPCATWTWQSNNILDYSGYNTIYNAPALTEGQVARAMANVADYRCAQLVPTLSAHPPANPQAFVIFDTDDTVDQNRLAGELGFRVFTGLSQQVEAYRYQVVDTRGKRIYGDLAWTRDTLPDVLELPAPHNFRRWWRRRPTPPFTLLLETQGELDQRTETHLLLESPPFTPANRPDAKKPTRAVRINR